MTQQEHDAAARLLATWGKRVKQYGGKSLTESQRDEVLTYSLALTAFREYKAKTAIESHEGPPVRITETLP